VLLCTGSLTVLEGRKCCIELCLVGNWRFLAMTLDATGPQGSWTTRSRLPWRRAPLAVDVAVCGRATHMYACYAASRLFASSHHRPQSLPTSNHRVLYCQRTEVPLVHAKCAAGRAESPRTRRREPSDYLRVLQVNTVGPFITTQAFYPLLKKKDTRTVVNVSSGLGSIAMNRSGGTPLTGKIISYTSSKAALNMRARPSACLMLRLCLAPGRARHACTCAPHHELLSCVRDPRRCFGALMLYIHVYACELMHDRAYCWQTPSLCELFYSKQVRARTDTVTHRHCVWYCWMGTACD
jgi:hypothetical protein